MNRSELARERFDQLWAQHGQALFAYIAWSIGDRISAEDLVADVFERALRHRRGFDHRRGSEQTWLYAIAVNLVRDHQRRSAVEGRAMERLRYEASLAAVGAGRGDSTDSSSLDAKLEHALNALSNEEREVVAMRFGADLSIAQIAAALRQPSTTVDGRLHRGLRKLRATLGA